MAKFFSTAFWTDLMRIQIISASAKIIAIVVLTVVAKVLLSRTIWRAVNAAAAREEAAGRETGAARIRTLGGLMRSLTIYTLVFVAGFMIVISMGLPPLPVATVASVLGLALGIGAQKLVRDVISGFFILLENQYSVGDFVTIDEVTGTVDEIGTRTTRLRDELGRMVFVSNGDISIVTNHSRGPLVSTIDVSVAPNANVEKVYEILTRIGEEIAEAREDVMSPFRVEGFSAMNGDKLTINLVGNIDPRSVSVVQADLRKRVYEALIKDGIDIA